MIQTPTGKDYGPNEGMRMAAAINKAIDTALERENALQVPRGYLGGSRIGAPCARQVAYEYFDARDTVAHVAALGGIGDEGAAADVEKFLLRRGTTFKGKTLRRFRMGHLHEDETAAWLRKAGFELHTHRPDGGQYGFHIAKGADGKARIAGHLDGCIVAGPVVLPYPLLWEHKVMKSSKWRDFQTKGLRVANPTYYGQVQIYMAYMDLGACLFTALNTDTSELHFELVMFDAGEAQRLSDLGANIVEARVPEELPRVAKDRTNFNCKWCSFVEQCWASDAPIATDTPPWLNPNTIGM